MSMAELEDTRRIATAEKGPELQLEDGGIHELIREQRALRSDIERLLEENRQLRLSEAQLTQPGRIDSMARQLGLAEPAPGQVIHPAAHADSATPVLAQVTPPSAPAK